MIDRDAAEYDEASYEVDYAGFCDEPCNAAVRLFPTEEPMASYRDASLKMLVKINDLVSFLHARSQRPTPLLWGVAFALGHPCTAGLTMLDVARQIGCTKQAISKIAIDLIDELGLPPSPSLKTEFARQTYKKTNGNRTQP
jgi:hypothetical protein